MIEITLDRNVVLQTIKYLKKSPKEVHRAIAVTQNRTVTFLKKEIAKEVSHNYEIKSKTVKGTLTSKKATSTKLEASVSAEGRSIYLGRFKTAPYNRKRQLWAKVKKGNKKVIPGLFRSRPEKLPMYRIPAEMHHIGRGGVRQVEKPFGPSVPQMIGNVDVSQEIARKARDMLNRRMIHELEWRFRNQ